MTLGFCTAFAHIWQRPAAWCEIYHANDRMATWKMMHGNLRALTERPELDVVGPILAVTVDDGCLGSTQQVIRQQRRDVLSDHSVAHQPVLACQAGGNVYHSDHGAAPTNACWCLPATWLRRPLRLHPMQAKTSRQSSKRWFANDRLLRAGIDQCSVIRNDQPTKGVPIVALRRVVLAHAAEVHHAIEEVVGRP